MSLDIVRRLYPSLDNATLLALARVQFETAAVNFFVSTLQVHRLCFHLPLFLSLCCRLSHRVQLCRSMRPRALWGFYGFPGNYYTPCVNASSPTPQCGYRHPVAGPVLRAQNNRMSAIISASAALYPSIYLDAGMNTTAAAPVNADYMAGAVEEALRLAVASSPPAPPPSVRAFAKPSYRDGIGEFMAPPCPVAALRSHTFIMSHSHTATAQPKTMYIQPAAASHALA